MLIKLISHNVLGTCMGRLGKYNNVDSIYLLKD